MCVYIRTNCSTICSNNDDILFSCSCRSLFSLFSFDIVFIIEANQTLFCLLVNKYACQESYCRCVLDRLVVLPSPLISSNSYSLHRYFYNLIDTYIFNNTSTRLAQSQIYILTQIQRRFFVASPFFFFFVFFFFFLLLFSSMRRRSCTIIVDMLYQLEGWLRKLHLLTVIFFLL